MSHPVNPPGSPVDDTEVTRIIARPGPKSTPFRTDPAPVVTPPAPVAAPAQVVLPADVVRPRPVMTPPGVPVRPAISPAPAPAAPVPAPVAAQSELRANPGSAPGSALPPAAPATPSRPDVIAPDEPVTGWLVVLKGPGRGASLALHGGRNALGAAPDQDLRLAFGDPAIAANGHAYLVYDDETRGFFIEDGKKKDLVRVNGQMLTETRPLRHGDDIRIGQTVLRFVAFCGPEFDWSEGDRPVAALPAPAHDPAPGPSPVASEEPSAGTLPETTSPGDGI